MRETKDFKFQVKAVNDDGTFSGYAATYGNVDLGDDVIEPGAFTKTLREKNNQSFLLWQHDQRQPIGDAVYTDEAKGLSLEGSLWLDMPRARDAHIFLKRSLEKKLPAGLSIGYDAVKKSFEGSVRHLQEVKLWESSIVTFPMNERALVTAVKGAEDLDEYARALTVLADEIKAGRTLSQTTRDRLQRSMDAMHEAMTHLTALMTDAGDGGKSAARHHDGEPGIHSAFDSLHSTLSKGFSA